MPAAEAAKAMRTAILEFQQKPRMAKAALDSTQPGVVVPYASASRATRQPVMKKVAAPAVAKMARAAAVAR
jgi:hypothetical protein